MADEHSGHGFLAGLIVGAVIGAGVAYWLIERRQPGYRGISSKASDFVSFIKEEVMGGAREAMRRAVEEGRDASQQARNDIEQRLRQERED